MPMQIQTDDLKECKGGEELKLQKTESTLDEKLVFRGLSVSSSR